MNMVMELPQNERFRPSVSPKTPNKICPNSRPSIRLSVHIVYAAVSTESTCEIKYKTYDVLAQL